MHLRDMKPLWEKPLGDKEMKSCGITTRLISILLICSIVFSCVACSSKASGTTQFTLSDPNSKVFTENTENELIIKEKAINEFITEEIYLKELVVAENKITELLLSEEQITEVILCKSIYVPEANIEEFAENSQTSHLFGENIDWSAFLKKFAIGTGIIVTLVVLKKAHLPDKLSSVIVSAAEKSLEFASSGAAIGSVFGAATGASDEIDESGRTSAVIAFATAVVGLIISVISLVAEVPSGGSSSVTLAVGVKLVIAGVGVLAAAAGTVKAGRDAIKAFTTTEASDIDWDNVDWDRVGCSSAEKAIENSADGYMWGAVIGAVKGGADGYDFYHKYNTPYTKYNARLIQTPKEGSGGKWSGKRGESDFILDEPIITENGTKITKVTYRNAVPDFSPFQEAQVKIPNITNKRTHNFSEADKALAEFWTKIKHGGRTWKQSDIKQYRKGNKLTWHEMSNGEYMQLVPTELNQTFSHYGGVAEYNAMIGEKLDTEFEVNYD